MQPNSTSDRHEERERVLGQFAAAGIRAWDHGTLGLVVGTDGDIPCDELISIIAASNVNFVLDFKQVALEDSDLARLTGHPGIQSLGLSSTLVTGAGLRPLATWPALKKLSIFGHEDLDPGIPWIASCRQLESLTILHSRLSDEALGPLSQLSSLSDLSFRSLPVGPGMAFLASLHRLEALGLVETHADDPVIEQLSHLMHLERLWLIECPITDRAMRVISQFKALTLLNISGTSVTSRGVSLVEGLSRLESLVVERLTLDERALQAIAACQSLTRLSLDGATFDVEPMNALMRQLPHCEVSIRNRALITDRLTRELLDWLLERYSGLEEEWVDSGCGILIEAWIRDGDAFCRRFGQVCRIRFLDLSDSQLTDHGLADLTGMTWLRHLDISHGVNVSAAGLARLAELSCLTSLRVATPDDPVAALRALGRCRNLRFLFLRDFDAIDTAVGELAALSRLKELDVCFTRWRTGFDVLDRFAELEAFRLAETESPDAAVAAVASRPALQALELAGCPIGDTGLQALQGHRTLSRVELTNLPVSDAGVAVFGSCPNLTRLSLTSLPIEGSAFDAVRELSDLEDLTLRDLPLSDSGFTALCRLQQLKTLSLNEVYLSAQQQEQLTRDLRTTEVKFY